MKTGIVNHCEITSPNRSHWIAWDHSGMSKEELYPVLSFELARGLGQRVAEFEANRYLHSEGWSEWRIILLNVKPGDGIGDDYHSPRRQEIAERGEELIAAWLASPDYRESRRRAVASMAAREVRDQGTRSYSMHRVHDMLTQLRPELAPADHRRLARATKLLAEAAELLEGTPAKREGES